MHVGYRLEGDVGHVTLDNPPFNVLEHPAFAALEELEGFLATPDLRGVVIRGAGNHFSSGANLEEPGIDLGDPAALAGALATGKRLLHAIATATVPVVAAIHGSCLGAGLEIALACHFRVATSGAMFGFPEAGHGLIPGLGGTRSCREALGLGRAVELVLSARMVGAAEAQELGLVDRVVARGELEEQAVALVRELTRGRSPRLVRAAMEALHAGRLLPEDEALRRETEIFCALAADRRSADTGDPDR